MATSQRYGAAWQLRQGLQDYAGRLFGDARAAVMPKLIDDTLLTSSILSSVRCHFTLGFHRANVKPLSVNMRPFMNDSATDSR